MYAHLDPNTALQIPKKVQYLRVTDAAWCCRLGLFVVSLVGGVWPVIPPQAAATEVLCRVSDGLVSSVMPRGKPGPLAAESGLLPWVGSVICLINNILVIRKKICVYKREKIMQREH